MFRHPHRVTEGDSLIKKQASIRFFFNLFFLTASEQQFRQMEKPWLWLSTLLRATPCFKYVSSSSHDHSFVWVHSHTDATSVKDKDRALTIQSVPWPRQNPRTAALLAQWAPSPQCSVHTACPRSLDSCPGTSSSASRRSRMRYLCQDRIFSLYRCRAHPSSVSRMWNQWKSRLTRRDSRADTRMLKIQQYKRKSHGFLLLWTPHLEFTPTKP